MGEGERERERDYEWSLKLEEGDLKRGTHDGDGNVTKKKGG